MDTGRGYLEPIQVDSQKENANPSFEEEIRNEITKMEAKHPLHGGIFYVGQNLELNGSKLRVLTMTRKTITLRVLPRQNND